MITYLMAKEALRQAIEKKGADYCDPLAREGNCRYVDTLGNPSCLVGTALELLDLPLPNYLSSPNNWKFYEEMCAEKTLRFWLSEMGYEFDEEAVELLKITQDEQDDGELWARAFEKAVNVLEGENDVQK